MNAIRVLECGHDFNVVLERRRMERRSPPILHDYRQVGPAL